MHFAYIVCFQINLSGRKDLPPIPWPSGGFHAVFQAWKELRIWGAHCYGSLDGSLKIPEMMNKVKTNSGISVMSAKMMSCFLKQLNLCFFQNPNLQRYDLETTDEFEFCNFPWFVFLLMFWGERKVFLEVVFPQKPALPGEVLPDQLQWEVFQDLGRVTWIHVEWDGGKQKTTWIFPETNNQSHWKLAFCPKMKVVSQSSRIPCSDTMFLIFWVRKVVSFSFGANGDWHVDLPK